MQLRKKYINGNVNDLDLDTTRCFFEGFEAVRIENPPSAVVIKRLVALWANASLSLFVTTVTTVFPLLNDSCLLWRR